MKKGHNEFSAITPEIINLADICTANDQIDPYLYTKYNVKKGLRDLRGKGVLTGLTEIAEVKSYVTDDEEMIACPGKLYYRGYDMEQLVQGFISERRFGFEETAYLLMMGQLPNKDQLNSFDSVLGNYRSLPTNFVRDVILKAPGIDIMNILARSVLTLYGYDDNPDDISIPNVMRQSLQLSAVLPLLSVYGYQAYKHYRDGDSLYIHQPDPKHSTAETIFHLLRPDSKFTKLEARTLDLCLVLHADHGGGNNSTFTTRVVSSTHTDTYSAIAAALGSLKGPRHGGANIKVVSQMEYIMKHVKDWEDEDEIENILAKILSGRCFDHQKLIYGVGHAVYTVSDPRAQTLKGFVDKLAREKGYTEQFELYKKIERIAPALVKRKAKMYRDDICVNVDFYSGLVYEMLGLPKELYTPLFAIARMPGWSAHRLEELVGGNKIIRPAYKNVAKHTDYVAINKR